MTVWSGGCGYDEELLQSWLSQGSNQKHLPTIEEKRTFVMHLKPYHKLSKKDPSLELTQTAREHGNHRSIAKEEKCTSTSTKQNLICTPISATFHKQSDTIWQASYVAGGKGPLNSIGVKVNALPVTIHHGEEGEGTLDIHAIIKPGNTKEKIAFFASHQCSNNRTGTMKVRSTWNINGRAAKRRKTTIEVKAKNSVEKMRGANLKSHQFEPFACGIDHCSVHFVEGANAMFSDGSLSVIEMVAFLEQRARALLSDSTRKCTNSCTVTRFTVQSKGVLSVSEHMTAFTPCEIPFQKGTFDNEEQEIETICVLDMVAKLESECLKHQSDHNAGSLSRNNSFRRHVGRLLLASGAHSSGGGEAVSPDARDSNVELGSFMHKDHSSSSSENLLAEDEVSTVPCKFSELPEVKNFYMPSSAVAKGTPLKSISCNIELNPDPLKNALPSCSKADEFQSEAYSTSQEVVTGRETNLPQTANKLVDFPVSEKLYTQEKSYTFSFCEDTLPGTLFFQHHDNHNAKDHADHGTSKNNLQAMNQITPASEDQACKSKRALVTLDTLSISYVEGATPAVDSLKDPVVHDFWKIRYKIQQLLEPQQYIVFLPHHIVVNIFRFLPTKTLAALKCTCHYFKFIIEYYDIRPVDSLWVCDLRYKDDPCKQCKKQYVKGDVSLCWWHPKPYCQSLPYGPGYWMCCHRSHKDSPGCKVGLHDNRWVPACHSFNRQMYKKRKEFEREDW